MQEHFHRCDTGSTYGVWRTWDGSQKKAQKDCVFENQPEPARKRINYYKQIHIEPKQIDLVSGVENDISGSLSHPLIAPSSTSDIADIDIRNTKKE